MFWMILFAATVSQGLFLSIGMGFKEKWKNPAINILSILILAFTFTLAYYLAFWLKIVPQLPEITSFAMQFTLLFGPLLWLYFQKIRKFSTKYAWLHFIPFILSVIAIALSAGTEYMLSINISVVILQNLQLVAYSVGLMLSVKEKPVRKLIYIFSGYTTCFLTYYVLVWTGLFRIQYDYIVSLGMAVFIYYLGYKGLKISQILPEAQGEKYSNSSLTSDALKYILNKLDKIMARDKLYLNGDLKLQELADALEVSIHSLSQAINTGKSQKFNDYLNELRVEEAKRLMVSKSHQNLKLLAIAIDSGFNNKTSFLNAFKKHTGQSPSDYREKVIAQAS